MKPMILCIQLKQWPHKYEHWKVLYGTNFDEEIWTFSHATIQIFFQQLFVYIDDSIYQIYMKVSLGLALNFFLSKNLVNPKRSVL